MLFKYVQAQSPYENRLTHHQGVFVPSRKRAGCLAQLGPLSTGPHLTIRRIITMVVAILLRLVMSIAAIFAQPGNA